MTLEFSGRPGRRGGAGRGAAGRGAAGQRAAGFVGLGGIGVLAAVLAFLLFAGVAPPPASAAPKDRARAISDEIICPCSCGEVLTGCTCETGKSMQGFIGSELKGGKSKDQITAALVAKYGEVILGAPKAKGFNLIVWVAPFLATLVGLILVTFILLRWARRRPDPELAGSGGATAGAAGSRNAKDDVAARRARAEAELRELRES